MKKMKSLEEVNNWHAFLDPGFYRKVSAREPAMRVPARKSSDELVDWNNPIYLKQRREYDLPETL